jgi:hypothetical protein
MAVVDDCGREYRRRSVLTVRWIPDGVSRRREVAFIAHEYEMWQKKSFVRRLTKFSLQEGGGTVDEKRLREFQPLDRPEGKYHAAGYTEGQNGELLEIKMSDIVEMTFWRWHLEITSLLV